jgi:hypothetical protein
MADLLVEALERPRVEPVLDDPERRIERGHELLRTEDVTPDRRLQGSCRPRR